MFKTLTAFAVSLFIVGTASAEWNNFGYVLEDGRRWKSSSLRGKTTKPNTPTYNTPFLYFSNDADFGLQMHILNGYYEICKEVRMEVTIDSK